MSEEYKKYDTNDRYSIDGVRLAKDAETRDVGDSKLTTITFVSTSRAESDSDLWIEAKIADHQGDMASFLKKGDILHHLEGKPAIRRYGDNNEKFSFQVRRTTFVPPTTLFAELKTRGWTPSAGKNNTAKKPAKPSARRQADPIDDDLPF